MRFAFYLFTLMLIITACNSSESPTPTPQTRVVGVEITTTAPPATPVLDEPTTTPVTATSSTANGGSVFPMMSGDGRYIVFASDATDLISLPSQGNCDTDGDGNAIERCTNIYRYDRETDELILISEGADGQGAEGYSILPGISDDGRYVVFLSSAPNLDAETNAYCEQEQRGPCGNIFLYDHTTEQIRWISHAFDGNNPNNYSLFPSISANGEKVVFLSFASNLVENDDNEVADIFLYDIASGQTRRLSIATSGEAGNDLSYYPQISGDGSIVTFSSLASNLVSNDTNNTADVFVHDLTSATTMRISIASDGTQGDGFSERSTLSNDGRYVVFESVAMTIDPIDGNFSCDLTSDDDPSENCRDVYLHDREAGTTRLISLSSNGGQSFQFSLSGHISGDGQSIAFANAGTGLVPRDRNEAYDVFVHDLFTSETSRVSVAGDGTEGNHNSGITTNPFEVRPTFDISDNGRYLVFSSSATNFVENDVNDGESCDPILIQGGFALQCSDIFLHDRDTGETILISSPRKTRN